MKRLVIVCVALCLIFSGCKYDEGPFITIREAETRLVGVWELVNVYKNGDKIITTDISANKPGTYYYIYFDYILSVTAIVNGNVRSSNQGFWKFENNEKELLIQFQLPGETYAYQAEIKKLTMSELRYEYTDEDGNIWRFEMYSRSHT